MAAGVRARGRSQGPVAPAATVGAGWTTGPMSLTVVLLLAVVVGLSVIGLIWVLSASSVRALRAYGSAWVYFERQLVWLAAGGLALVGTARADYRRWRRLSVPLLALSVALLLLVLVPGLGVSVSGSTRWLGAGSLRMQPSELAKLAVLVFGADVLARRRGTDLPSVPPVLTAFLAVGVLIMLQPDMGTMLVVLCVVMALLFVSGTSLLQLAGLSTAGLASALLLGMVAPYRRARLLSFRHPFRDAGNTGYQVAQSLIGISSGGLAGVGIGASRAKWGFLPNAHTDFIFAIIAEEAGLIGGLLVVVLFAAFAVLGIRAARRAPDPFGALVATGVTAWVLSQAFINIGAVTGILPVTGVPLPFVSFGGSSLVILLGAVGVVLNIARQGSLARARQAPSRPPGR